MKGTEGSADAVCLQQKTQQDLSEQISSSIKEAEDVCESGSAQECASAWDEVEELSAEAAHQKDNQKWVQKGQSNDPLEEYCEENPESDVRWLPFVPVRETCLKAA